jgi:hypothetical protein
MRDREQLLPSRVHGALSRVGKARIERLSRQFRRNAAHAGNNNKGVCFDVLGVFQSFPGAEAHELNTSRFFVESQAAQSELVSWARNVVPQHRSSLQEVIDILRAADPAAPVDIPTLLARLEQIASGFDVYHHCTHLAETTVPADDPSQRMEVSSD